MLTLSRKIGETIMIGDDIEVTLTRIERDSVRLSIKAPPSVRILREELIRRMAQEKTKEDQSPNSP